MRATSASPVVSLDSRFEVIIEKTADMKSPETFWTWFIKNERRYRNVKTPEKEQLLDELLFALQDYSAGLLFEIGGHPDGLRELVISAAGDVRYFPDVKDLISAAPTLEGWEFTAFKQPQGFEFTTEYEGVTIVPSEAWFLPLVSQEDPQALGLRIAVPDFNELLEETFVSACYIVLDTGLGELQVAEHIWHVEVCGVPTSPESEGFFKLIELGSFLKWFESRADVQ
jgi:hypothetical protein